MSTDSRSIFNSLPHSGVTARKLAPVDPRVRHSLHRLALDFSKLGVRIFLFGSAARNWPLAPVNADFDLGFEFDSSRPDAADLRRRLQKCVDSLPSIRPVDLVDFTQATLAFRSEAEACIVELAHESSPATEN